jgi:hypothetical protein
MQFFSVCSINLFLGAVCAHPQLMAATPPGQDEVEIMASGDSALGTRDAASQGFVGASLIKHKPLLRPADVLEFVPGMVVTQHSGDGKANQYFLRGMNLDHGTDFATTVNGVPVNMPSHAHGQGYSDLNYLMPELVQRIDYRKGPYFAGEGDFSSAGSARIAYRTRLDQPFADVSLGQRGYARTVVAGSREIQDGVHVLAALEVMHNNGPWTQPEGLRKTNALLTLSGGTAAQGWSSSLMSYAAQWRATEQVPQRLLDAGVYEGQPFGRFDSLDASDGGNTRRTSLSGQWHSQTAQERVQLSAYAMRYDLDLFSNFTYQLNNPASGDQFGQSDQRSVWGGRASKSWITDAEDGTLVVNTLGLDYRHDHIRLGLFNTAARQMLSTVRDDRVQQSLLGVHAENATTWTPWLRTVAGVRADVWRAQVQSLSLAANSGQARSSQLSPKLSLILGPWANTEFFLNAARGFHSNDARGATSRVDPVSGSAISPVAGLVPSLGQEVGLKTQWSAQWQSSLALWQLDMDSELVYLGDAGSTEAGRPSRRQGLEFSHQGVWGQHLGLDMSLAWTRARYTDQATAGPFIPNAVQRVANLTVTLRNMHPWSGAVGWRYIGPAPLREDNAVRAPSSLTLNLRLQRQLRPDLDLSLDVLNLTDRQNIDVAYFYTSRLTGEATGVDGVHVHPAEPRTVRVSLRYRF